MTDEQIEAALKAASRLEKRIQRLGDQQDEILTPVAGFLRQPENAGALAKHIEAMPRGFFRSELRTMMIVREAAAEKDADNVDTHTL